MNESTEPLSPRGRARRDAMLADLLREVARRRYRRRARVATLFVAGGLVLSSAWALSRSSRAPDGHGLGDVAASRGSPSRPLAERVVPPGGERAESSPPRLFPRVTTVGEPRAEVGRIVPTFHVPVVRNDTSSWDRVIRRIDDRELASLLRGSGRAPGVIRVGGRVLLEEDLLAARIGVE